MGMSAHEFDVLTPAQFIYAQLGYLERLRQQELMMLRVQRWGAYAMLSPWFEKGNVKSMTELLPIPGDEIPKSIESSRAKELTLEQRKQRVSEILKEFKNGK